MVQLIGDIQSLKATLARLRLRAKASRAKLTQAQAETKRLRTALLDCCMANEDAHMTGWYRNAKAVLAEGDGDD
jgi:predicted  nucleic acid-binding Zn-ribbon protein